MPLREQYSQGEFCWVDLNSLEMGSAAQFYGQLFGWDKSDFDTQGGPPYAAWTQGGRLLGGLGQMSDEMKAQGMRPTWNGYIRVDDAAATEQRAVALGAQVIAPTMSVMNAGRMAFLADPTGAVFAIWQPQQQHGAQVWGEDNAPCWCELATRDIEQARAFYESLVGWQCADFPGTPTKYYVAHVSPTQMTGGMMQMTAEWGDMPAHWSVYFQVANVDDSCARCAALGGQVCVPPFDAGVGRIAGCTDPQGAFFYLIKLASPS